MSPDLGLRFERVLDLLPRVVLDDAGRLSSKLLFGRRSPTFVGLRPADCQQMTCGRRRSRSARPGLRGSVNVPKAGLPDQRHRRRTGGHFSEPCVDADLERIVVKHLADVYQPELARWYKIMNASYTQRRRRAEWFLERRGRPAGRFS